MLNYGKDVYGHPFLEEYVKKSNKHLLNFKDGYP